jgi:hypothetical protein
MQVWALFSMARGDDMETLVGIFSSQERTNEAIENIKARGWPNDVYEYPVRELTLDELDEAYIGG